MPKENPLKFYEETAISIGIPLKDLTKKKLYTSINQSGKAKYIEVDNYNEIVINYYCEDQKLFFSELKNDYQLIAGTHYRLDKNQIKANRNTLIGLEEELKPEFIFTLEKHQRGFSLKSNIRIFDGIIISSILPYSTSSKGIFEMGLDFRPALLEMMKTYHENKEVSTKPL
jgi:hypothetical protein